MHVDMDLEGGGGIGFGDDSGFINVQMLMQFMMCRSWMRLIPLQLSCALSLQWQLK